MVHLVRFGALGALRQLPKTQCRPITTVIGQHRIRPCSGWTDPTVRAETLCRVGVSGGLGAGVEWEVRRVDPNVVVAAVAAAVSAGALTGVTEGAKQAVADAYTALKGVLTRKYSSVDVAMVEAKPESLARQDVLEAELVEAGVDGDGELRGAAEHVLRLVHEHAPQAAELVGVKLTRVRAGELEITNIRAKGASGVNAQDVQVNGKFVIKDVDVEQQPPHPR